MHLAAGFLGAVSWAVAGRGGTLPPVSWAVAGRGGCTLPPVSWAVAGRGLTGWAVIGGDAGRPMRSTMSFSTRARASGSGMVGYPVSRETISAISGAPLGISWRASCSQRAANLSRPPMTALLR
ncbi:hypothetical protein [Candidatus Amarolinea dominans]|uniref:hypothetical protein n=1 Tax=Candidatus Amarolinea dominans TaxID=3140696 RepID=UPI0031374C70|nr:hypothetical protein [Anaerolineae bacterium]